jgi:transcriptional regulator with XRE-family HTH domain
MPKRTQDMPAEYTDYERALAQAIGARIRQRRKVLRLTQEQIRIRMETESVSVTRARFSRIEKGDALANAAEIVALATALAVSHDWLLTGTAQSGADR